MKKKDAATFGIVFCLVILIILGSNIYSNVSSGGYYYIDLESIPYIISMFILFFSVFFTSLLAHELGHGLFFYLKKKKKIRFIYNNFVCYAGEQKDYDELTDKEYTTVNIMGIIFGALPIFLSSFFVIYTLFLLVPYGFAIKQDLEEAFKNVQLEDD